MHGNTKTATGGIKTRAMHDIVSEISASLRIHASMGSKLNGIHLELTGDITPEGESVTECTGGSMELAEEELALRFESYCDRQCSVRRFQSSALTFFFLAARLNFEQSLGAVAHTSPVDSLLISCATDVAFMLSQAGGRGRSVDNKILKELSISRPNSEVRPSV